jgi:ABC-type transport system involved in multi-copper enzyme maturation permease subunit
MNQIFRYILRNGLRDRIYLGLFITLIATFATSAILGDTMVSEQKQTSVAFIAGTSRIIIACGMILFVCLAVSRSFEHKEVEFILSKPISREQFIFAYLFGFFVASLLVIFPLSVILAFMFSSNWPSFCLWVLSMMVENLLVICFALLGSLILRNSFSAILVSIGFYAISRLMGVFVMAINMPKTVVDVKFNITGSLLKLLSVAFPRLDLFAQTSWLIYKIEDFSSFKIMLFQSIVFTPLLIFMALHDFKKKQF